MVFSGQMGRCRVFLGLLGLLLGSGCTTVGPDYVLPQPDMPGEFKTDLQEKRFNAEAESEKTADEAKPDIPVKVVTQEMLATWWETLEDPLLIRLVDKAIGNNLELKVAQSRVREERAQRGIAESARLPNVNAVGGVSRRQNASAANAGGAVGSTLYSSGFDASWEIDLFGGIQRSVEAAGATVEATQEQLNDTLVTLVAEVALNYIEIRTFQARLQAAEKNQKTQEETLRIVEDRLEGGLSTTLSLEQAKYNLESTRSEIPTLKIGIEKAKNGLTVLLGEFPGSLDKDLDEYSRVPVTPMEVAVGVPADLLRRRPDVRQSERELAAQTARVGVATADLYPKLRLLGSVGLETLSAASFFGGPAAAYQIG
ncbi:MAG: TolC family protein, partial [Nitrospina sp.]|nr:TolC family protein [Nitrospina sp.]